MIIKPQGHNLFWEVSNNSDKQYMHYQADIIVFSNKEPITTWAYGAAFCSQLCKQTTLIDFSYVTDSKI